jgi:hypothetical protein
MDLHAAADLSKLNTALSEGKVSASDRMALKSALARLGVID